MKKCLSFLKPLPAAIATMISGTIFVAIFASAITSCNKSNDGSSSTQVNKGDLPGNLATRVLINTTNGHTDTIVFALRPDTLQFTSDGKLNAAYYVQSFDTTTDQVVW